MESTVTITLKEYLEMKDAVDNNKIVIVRNNGNSTLVAYTKDETIQKLTTEASRLGGLFEKTNEELQQTTNALSTLKNSLRPATFKDIFRILSGKEVIVSD